MRLNIETKQPKKILGILRRIYSNQMVHIEETYPSTCTYKIENPYTIAEQRYPVEGVLELANHISIHKIYIL